VGTGGGDGRGRGGLSAVVVRMLLAVAVAAVGGCARGKPQPATSSTVTTVARVGEAEAAARDVELSSAGPSKVWVGERRARLDGFEAAAAATLTNGDCAAQAEGVRTAVGDFEAWVAEITAAPDPVLSESLVTAAIGVRATLSACAGATERLTDQRGALEGALAAVRARRARIASA